MLDRILKFFAVVLVSCFLLPGCAYMSKSGRQQMAYERYVQKSIHRRNKGKMKITKEQQRIPDSKPSKYEVKSGVVDSPQSVTTNEPASEAQAEQ
jgi:hypothetical protein